MTNKYLEKIAGWTELEDGVHYNYDNDSYNATPEARARINSKLDTRHRNNGAMTFAAAGAAATPLLGIAAGAKYKGLAGIKRVAKASGIAGVAGGALGYGLAHLGNKQTREYVNSGPVSRDGRFNDYVYDKANRTTLTTAYKLYGPRENKD